MYKQIPLRFGISCDTLSAMRLISVKEYAKLNGYESVSTVYEQIRQGKIKTVPFQKTVKRIQWDDITQTAVNCN